MMPTLTRALIRMLPVVAVVLCATTAFAQVFPRLEKDKVEARIEAGKVEDETEPEVTDEPAPEVDGQKALARYKELLKQYTDNQREYRKNITKHTDEMPEPIGDYYEGQLLLNMGMYKEARRVLEKVGHEINKDELANREQMRAADEILEGRAYYLWGVAAAMEEWKDFDDKEDAVEGWLSAEKAYSKVRNTFARLVKREDVPNGEVMLQSMQVWTVNADDKWEALVVAEKSIETYPGNINSWRLLIEATRGTEGRGRNLYTPHFLKQRAALEVLKEFWPDNEAVTGGDIDVALAGTHLGIGQLDNWESHYAIKDYHTEEAKKTLNRTKLGAAIIVKAIEALEADS